MNRNFRYQEVERIGHDINHDLDNIPPEKLNKGVSGIIDTQHALLFEKLNRGMSGIIDTQHALLLAIHEPRTENIELHLAEEGRLLFYKKHVLCGACKRVMVTQESIFIQCLSEQASNLPFRIMRLEDTEPKESFIFVPLILDWVTAPLGVLSVQHPQAHTYTQEDLSILQLLAKHIASALHHIRQRDNIRLLVENWRYLDPD